MRKLLLLTIIFTVSFIQQGLAATFPERPPFDKGNTAEDTVVMVEVDGDPNEILAKIEQELPNSQFRKMFQSLFTGFSLQLKKQDIAHLEGIAGIKRVDPLRTYEVTLDESVPFIGGGNIRGKLDKKGQRLTGKGIKIAVIDTGIDYDHPDLKKNFKGGYDVIDQDGDPMETTREQGLSTIHGTHVAGIIAANGKIKGVAPEAEIYAYRALGPGGKGTTEQVIEAIEKAVEDGVDIINLSLGNTVNGPDWPTSIALDKAVEKGVIAVTSNGNSGPNMWTVGSPGTSLKAISVGASTPPLKVPYLTFKSEDREISLNMMVGSKPWTHKRDYPIKEIGLGRVEDMKEVKGKVVLVKRGVIPFYEKAKTAQDAGAIGVIIYNNTPGAFMGSLEMQLDIPVVSISKEDGEWLKDQLDVNEKNYIRTIYRKEEDQIAPFSSRGPVTHTWGVKPDVVAPGVSIDSTIPKGYLGLNGTSMSAPHVAGTAALVKQAHPDWSPEEVKAAIMNTAKPIENLEGIPYSPHEQGTGRIQVGKAVHAETLVYPGTVGFGKWTREQARHTKDVEITIKNTSQKTRTYHVKPPFVVPDGVQWKVPFSITLKPGEETQVPITIDILPAVFQSGIHYGEFVVEGGKDPVRVPYMFFIEEPNYPRLMAFSFEFGDEQGKYRYEIYLPGGADEVGIALYDPDTFKFIKYLDVKENVERGLLEVELDELQIEEGIYKTLVYANKEGKEDLIETMIYIGEDIEKISGHNMLTR
ncbi:S8 family serine peptidase [Anaerobacillus sp. CMMVII]|uniref:S8 family serine peptidase n=1 Tax=Anaerobacillus sp. CMMVII TaxID=2755588 RepID=UPI0021B78DB3|nr:S8 family serine peptidase [Anaerobacillus sp. CMMVII]MCT8140098.1 S8 family serine peptidase [Anaerobacillus sp. CMMVII]